MKTNKVIKYFLSIVTAYSFNGVNAQSIKMGMQCPDIVYSNVLNYSDTILKFSDFPGKIIILDFWNHGCLSCIQAFSKLDSLQKQFSDKMQIILVNNESKDSTLRFLKKHKKIKLPAVPVITGGEKLWDLFPNSGAPYHAWLDSNRVLSYLPAPYNLTAEHINDFAAGKKLNIYNYTYDRSASDTSMSQAVFYSVLSHCNILTGYREFEAQQEASAESVHMCKPCYSVKDLFIKAYSEFGKYNFGLPSLIFFESNDTYSYVKPEDNNLLDDWKTKFSYSYDLVIPTSKKEERYKFMQQDLERYFDFTAAIEKRKIKCLALVSKASPAALRSKGGSPLNTLIGKRFENDSIRYLRNVSFKSFSDLIGSFIEYSLKIPFVDRSGLSGNMDISIRDVSIEPFNLNELRKDLLKYDLDIIESYAYMPVLVVKEKK